jgi:hypothetical protein
LLYLCLSSCFPHLFENVSFLNRWLQYLELSLYSFMPNSFGYLQNFLKLLVVYRFWNIFSTCFTESFGQRTIMHYALSLWTIVMSGVAAVWMALVN